MRICFLIRTRDINMTPVGDAAAAVVLYANTGNIDTVIADGVIRKRHGQLTHPNLDDLIDQLQESTTSVLMRANEFDLAERMHFVRGDLSHRQKVQHRAAARRQGVQDQGGGTTSRPLDPLPDQANTYRRLVRAFERRPPHLHRAVVQRARHRAR